MTCSHSSSPKPRSNCSRKTSILISISSKKTLIVLARASSPCTTQWFPLSKTWQEIRQPSWTYRRALHSMMTGRLADKTSIKNRINYQVFTIVLRVTRWLATMSNYPMITKTVFLNRRSIPLTKQNSRNTGINSIQLIRTTINHINFTPNHTHRISKQARTFFTSSATPTPNLPLPTSATSSQSPCPRNPSSPIRSQPRCRGSRRRGCTRRRGGGGWSWRTRKSRHRGKW